MSELPDFRTKMEILDLIEARLRRGPSRRAQRFMALGGATALSLFGISVGLEISWPLFVGWALLFAGINWGVMAFLRHPLRDRRTRLLDGESADGSATQEADTPADTGSLE